MQIPKTQLAKEGHTEKTPNSLRRKIQSSDDEVRDITRRFSVFKQTSDRMLHSFCSRERRGELIYKVWSLITSQLQSEGGSPEDEVSKNYTESSLLTSPPGRPGNELPAR
jgi:hypothetical protein